jgi:diadenosine tetraphosphate (Ap4A) HIT family hydrolase
MQSIKLMYFVVVQFLLILQTTKGFVDFRDTMFSSRNNNNNNNNRRGKATTTTTYCDYENDVNDDNHRSAGRGSNIDDNSSSWPYKPPSNVDYATNPSVFGKILRGEFDALILDESTNLLAFQDISPRAPFHGLIISKQYIPTIHDIDSSHSHLLKEMKDMAHTLLKNRLSHKQYQHQDYILCFHIPPYNSVNHLHLHVLAPKSQMNIIYKDIKYNTSTRWCIDLSEVLERIETNHQTSVPYKKDASLWTVLCETLFPQRH